MNNTIIEVKEKRDKLQTKIEKMIIDFEQENHALINDMKIVKQRLTHDKMSILVVIDVTL